MSIEHGTTLLVARARPNWRYDLRSLDVGRRQKYRHQNRSYKALHRRGLATEDFQVTQAGSEVYQSYCSMGKSITEQMEERRQEFDSNLSLGSLEPQTLSLEPNTYDQDLQTVIACWPKLPIELRMLIADAARRISDR